jgi:hypothetical protein
MPVASLVPVVDDDQFFSRIHEEAHEVAWLRRRSLPLGS